MLFRTEDSIGFGSRAKAFNLNTFNCPVLELGQVDVYIADKIRKEVNGANNRTVLSYSKSLAICILKYNQYVDNELHFFDDYGYVNTLLYLNENGEQQCMRYSLYEKVSRVPIISNAGKITLQNFIVDISNNMLVDTYLRLYTGTGRKKVASPEKDSEVVVMVPVNDAVIEEYMSAVYVLYALQYRYGFLINDFVFKSLINKIQELPQDMFGNCSYDEQSSLIRLLYYLKYNWNYEKNISQKIYNDYVNSVHLNSYYDSINEFHTIVSESFNNAYYISDYNDNAISSLLWSECYRFLKGEYNYFW